MEYSRGANQSGAMTEDQFKELLVTMMSGLKPVKSAATFSRTPVQDIIKRVID